MAIRTVSARRRTGFTLVEIITDIGRTAIVVTIAVIALSTATDARATIDEHAVTLEAEAGWRAMVTDMLRHAPASDAVSEPLLSIGQDGHVLVFLSQGVV